jgi:hypothetical protein
MQERVISEIDVRALLADAENLMEQIHGTFIVSSNQEGRRWELIVVPDFENRKIVVVSAYPLS